jgi:hypothetical protein
MRPHVIVVPERLMAVPFELETSVTPRVVVEMTFPEAVTNQVLVTRITKALEPHGYVRDKTLLATSFCCDEVNRELENDLRRLYGNNFSMGGLAGFPFGGVTSFKAMAHHVPDGGNCLVVYGPHVGVDSAGNVGFIDRRGRRTCGDCCGSAAAAAAYVKSVQSGKVRRSSLPTTCIDMQQHFVGQILLPHAQHLETARNPQKVLPLLLFQEQDKLMKEIVGQACGEVAGEGKIALLGGVQINTPSDCPDYFLPLTFELYNNMGEATHDLLWGTSTERDLRP